MFWDRITYITNGLRVTTNGLYKRGQRELSVAVNDASLLREAPTFLKYVVSYLEESKRQIFPGQTLRYGYWLVKFVANPDEPESPLDVWEYNSTATDFIQGGSLSIRYWLEQHKICKKYNSVFAPPNADGLISISSGVIEGLPVQGMRYPWPEPMTGWLIVTDQFDGNMETLTNHHAYHITSARPDIVPYISLSPGFGFDLRKNERVWYDEIAVREHLAEYFGEQGVISAGFKK